MKKTSTSLKLFRIGCALLLISFCVLGSMELLFDPLGWILNIQSTEKLRTEVPAAQDRWQSYGIKNYVVDVQGFASLSCIMDITLVVRDDQLTEVRARKISLDKSLPKISVPPSKWDQPFCSYRNLLIPAMFDQVKKDLARIDTASEAVNVSFDPAYGFVQSYRHYPSYRFGLLSPVASPNGNAWYEYSQFRPMDSH